MSTLYFIVILNIAMFLGCKPNEKDYMLLLNSNEKNASASYNKGELNVTAKYLPSAIMALREAGNSDSFNANYKDLITNYLDASFFELTFQEKSGTKNHLQKVFLLSDRELTSFDQYINFGIQSDIQLIVGNTSIPCTYIHREISEGLTNIYSYTLGFAISEKEFLHDRSDPTIQLNSKYLQLENIFLAISRKQFSSLPVVKP